MLGRPSRSVAALELPRALAANTIQGLCLILVSAMNDLQPPASDESYQTQRNMFKDPI